MARVIKKYKRAVIKCPESQKYFDDLTNVMPDNVIRTWTAQITEAEAKRLESPTAMDVMRPNIPQCTLLITFTGNNTLISSSSTRVDRNGC